MNHLIFFLSVGAKGAWAPGVDDREVRDRRTGRENVAVGPL